ncbi:hypothetical protein AVEN_58386-1 [Araneus ventricosus]|uniref:H15 domain-containing protein n=1 Tax=Araneus ventricosus TaxID=182803 RepID=A0A4Y2IB53_ARAVE|nr:hypothetical protein AVEN_58386-1 [Araneus ventricosus]
MAVDKVKKQSNERAKIRRWILKAIEDMKGGATPNQVQKFVDSKQEGLLSKPDLKLNLKKLLDSGHLTKKEGKFVIKKRKPTGKGTKKSTAKKAVGKDTKKSTAKKAIGKDTKKSTAKKAVGKDTKKSSAK